MLSFFFVSLDLFKKKDDLKKQSWGGRGLGLVAKIQTLNATRPTI